MATTLRSYDWSIVSRNNKRARSRSYPWDDWFDGRIWQLEPKTDFDGPATSLERVIRTSANRRGIKVRIRLDNGNVVIQSHEDGSPMRTVTKSPSAKSIRERKATEPGANGDKPVAKSVKPVKPVTKPAKSAAKSAATKRVVKRATPQAPAPAKRRKLVKASA